MLCPYKWVSTPPRGEANRVDDLAISDNGDGTFTLSWHYRNLGDYDQDGTVAVEDIIPLAEHFGETYEPEDTNCIQAVIDGSGNGRIGIEDITPIAMHFAAEVEHYAIEGAEEEAGSYELVNEILQDTGSGDGRLEYSAIIESPAALWHRVVPYDTEDNPGEPSNAVLRPSNEPIIYEVSPTEGYQHEEYTFSATVTGAEPREYAWDFGGGATPDTSSETSPTVTLADAGEYAASLTVTNADGSASFPFSLIVSERDMWAHTWGGERNEWFREMAIDDEGCAYLVGQTSGFGAGATDALILKYSPEGEVLWAKTWGGEVNERFTGIEVTADGYVYVVGETNSFGAGNDDLLLLKCDPEGNLVWAKTWGTAEGYERTDGGLDVDTEGNIYVCGYYAVWGGEDDIMLVKFSPEGDALWARTWGGSSDDRSRDVLATPDGVYVCGYTESFGAGEEDMLVLKFSIDGESLWAITAGGSDYDSASSICVDEGNIYIAGSTRSYGQGNLDSLLLKCNTEGDVMLARTWGDTGIEGVRDLAVDHDHCLFAVSHTTSFGAGKYDVLLLRFDAVGTPLWAKVWGAEESEQVPAVVINETGDVYVGARAPNAAGEWMDVEGMVTEPELIIGFPEGTERTIEGIQTTPEGTETSPIGTIDSGGGGDDFLLLKNFPR